MEGVRLYIKFRNFINRECNEMGGTCKGRVNKIMYAWAMDAPALSLPKSK